MIDERHHTVRAMQATQRRLPGAVIFKLADRSTVGIADWTASAFGSTFWIEDKYQRKGEKLRDLCPTQQLITCHRLWQATQGRCWVFVYEQEPEQLTIWTPRFLFAHIWPKLAGPLDEVRPGRRGRLALGCTPVYASEGLNALNTPLHEIVADHGALRIPGWCYDAAPALLEGLLR